MSMESSQISPDENLDNTVLSEHDTIKGKLHLDDVFLILENKNCVLKQLDMLYDSASILQFKIHDTTVDLDLEWTNFPPHPKVTAYSFYTIYAKRIWWENVPDLYDPFG